VEIYDRFIPIGKTSDKDEMSAGMDGVVSVLRIALIAACLGVFGAEGGSADGRSEGQPVPRMETRSAITISHFTGKPVPRFERLRASEVNGRAGPSLSHPVLWTYGRAGLPVLVIKESIDWRRVRDPDGDEVWIHRSLLAGGSTALLVSPATLVRTPEADAAAVADLEAGVVAALLTCEAGWCRIAAGRRKGWVPEAALWGARVPGDPL